jgi:hypothetical protein
VNEAIMINSKYRYVFDGDYFLRIRSEGYNFYVNPRLHVAGYRLHGSNLSLNIPPKRVAELADLYRIRLSRPGASLYLSVMAKLLRACEFVPLVGGKLKRLIRSANNAASYLTCYWIPSI